MHKTLLLNIGRVLATPGKLSEKVEGVYKVVKDMDLDVLDQAALFITLFEIVHNAAKQLESEAGFNNDNHIGPKLPV